MPDLFALRDLDPPMGDTAAPVYLARTRALWTARLPGEDDLPKRRIVHVHAVDLHAPARLRRVGVRRAQGYHKCGSLVDLDHVAAFRVFAYDGTAWRLLRDERSVPDPGPADGPDGGVLWFDLPPVETTAVRVGVRRSDADGGWPSWNLATNALLLEADDAPPPAPRDERLLRVEGVDLGGLPEGVAATVEEGAVRFRTPHLDVAFALTRAAMTHLSLHGEGATGPRGVSLLRTAPGTCYQGPTLAPVGAAPVVMPTLRCRADGTTTIEGATVRYRLALDGGVRYEIAWTVEPDALRLHVVRDVEAPVHAHTSSAWTFGLDPRVSPAHVVGRVLTTGETGRVALPAWLDVPRFGSLRIESGGDVELRADVFRAEARTSVEVKLAETATDDGDALLPAGRAEATVTFRLDRLDVPLREGVPAEVRDALRRCALTALTYRPDTATLTNNGASMHCPICLDAWAALTTRLGDVLPGLPADDLVRTTLERWLADAPGYASGWLVQDGRRHLAEDEYLMTGTAALLGLAEYLGARGTPAWVAAQHDRIGAQIARMRARDLDGDGLVESPYRTGTSGSGQWSTCWWDVLSFGWKDAFANALLYPALRGLADVLPRLGAPDLADGLDDWAGRLRAAYSPTFLNPATGWLAGWRCAEGRLHDYAFLFPTGAAVCHGLLEDTVAHSAVRGLLAELRRAALPDASLGLPGNLWPVPDADRADILQGYPYGFYQNGGLTHSQARHFVGAMYRTGIADEADALLVRLCAGLAEGRVLGGMGSGRDWHFPDGRACGYEGLLSDQFGVLALALERWGEGQRPGSFPI